jgi:hypothetical protein
MTDRLADVSGSQWWGTSDAPATVLRRAGGTPSERWLLLSDLVDLALASGALERARQLKQAHADGWVR